ncbi:MAG: RluA family pseudouridine synthase [Cyclobacteriaceae bacterium]
METPAVLYEDNHLLILNKPAGWLVQGDKTGDYTLTDWGKDYIKEQYKKPGAVFLNPTHRLDRPVSGIVVFGRTSKGTERMTKLFRDDQIKKSYLTIVNDKPKIEIDTIVHYLKKDTIKNVAKAYAEEKKGTKRAELYYEMIWRFKGHSLMLVEPKTGRPHQIRVQMRALGCPIKGDLKYGYPKPNRDKSISLHAFKLSFEHPVKKEQMEMLCQPEGELWEPYKKPINELGR